MNPEVLSDYDWEVRDELISAGKTWEWAEWAIGQIDLAHYYQKYFPEELASLILQFQHNLHNLA